MEIHRLDNDQTRLMFPDSLKYKWIVYHIQSTHGGYEGQGEGVALRYDGLLDIFDLSWDSRSKPLPGNPVDEVTPEEYLKPQNSVLAWEPMESVFLKIKELLEKEEAAA